MKKYLISKQFGVTLTLGVISLLVTIVAGISLFRLFTLPVLKEENLYTLESGQYVWVMPDRMPMEPDIRIMSTLGRMPDLDKAELVMVPVGEDIYAPVWITVKRDQEELKGLKEDGVFRLTIMAKVQMDQEALNIQEIEETDGSKLRVAGNLHLIQVVRTEVLNIRWIALFLGICGLVATFCLYFGNSGISLVYDQPFQETQRYKFLAYRNNYVLEAELQREKNRLLEIRRKQKRNACWTIFLFPLFALGIFLFIVGAMTRPITLLGIYALVFGFCLCVLYIERFAVYYVNSEWESAKRLSKRILPDTLSVQAENTSILIGVLNRRIRQEEKQKEEMAQGEEQEVLWDSHGEFLQTEHPKEIPLVLGALPVMKGSGREESAVASSALAAPESAAAVSLAVRNLTDGEISQLHRKQEDYDENFIPMGVNDRISIGIEEGGRVIAALDAQMTAFHILYLSSVFVDGIYRGKGYGKALILEMERRAKKLEADVVRLDVFDWQGVGFFQAMGYEQVGFYGNDTDGYKEYFFLKRL